MHFLPKQNAMALNRSVGSEIRNCREGVRLHGFGRFPILKYNRRQGVNPRSRKRWNIAHFLTDRLADGDEVGVPVHSSIDAISLPELVERRIKVHVDARRNRGDGRRRQHPRDVEHRVEASQLVLGRDDLPVDSEGTAHIVEVRDRIPGRVVDRLSEQYFVPEATQAEDVLQDCPSCAALIRVPSDHPGHDDPQRGRQSPTSSSMWPRTLSESKYSTAIARAVSAWVW